MSEREGCQDPDSSLDLQQSESAHTTRARFHVHFIPTSSSWLNLVERWFKELTDKRLRWGSFSSVGQPVFAIEDWAAHWNEDPKLFVWHRTAEEIIEKVRRGRAALALYSAEAPEGIGHGAQPRHLLVGGCCIP